MPGRPRYYNIPPEEAEAIGKAIVSIFAGIFDNLPARMLSQLWSKLELWNAELYRQEERNFTSRQSFRQM